MKTKHINPVQEVTTSVSTVQTVVVSGPTVIAPSGRSMFSSAVKLTNGKDEFTYSPQWTCDGGSFIKAGPRTIYWNAPTTSGTYKIECNVAGVSSSLTVDVLAPGEQPTPKPEPEPQKPAEQGEGFHLGDWPPPTSY